MRRIFLMMAVAIAGLATANAQLKFGVTAGLNVSTFSGDVENAKFTPGFQIGAVVDYALTDYLSIIPELQFTQRGFKISESESQSVMGATATNSTEITTTLNYLEIPINIAYKYSLDQSGTLMAFAGPYIGYALNGKSKGAIKVDVTGVPGGADVHTSQDIDEKIEFGSENGKVNALDFGLNLGVGYQYTNIFFKLQYNLGLTNLSNVDNQSTKNSNIALSVGYMF